LRLLSETKRALTHADVVDELSDRGWDASTLYRNLQDLTESGIFRRTEQGDRLWRYELRGEEGGHLTHHPHFICTECGDVRCLPGMSFTDEEDDAVPKAVAEEDVEIQVRGLCDTCR
jgi:Fur family ferric uptake transcriptional regulator